MVGVAVMSTGEPDPTVIVVAGCEATAVENKVRKLQKECFLRLSKYKYVYRPLL